MSLDFLIYFNLSKYRLYYIIFSNIYNIFRYIYLLLRKIMKRNSNSIDSIAIILRMGIRNNS